MAIEFNCPSCGKAFSVPEGKAGASARCRECGARVTVPVPDTTPPEADAQKETPAPVSPQPAAVEAKPAKPRTPRRASTHRRASPLWLKVALGVLGLAIVAGGAVYLLSSHGGPRGAILSIEQTEDPDEFIVHYTWDGTPWSRVKKRCFMIAGVAQGSPPDLGDLPDIMHRAGMSMSKMAGARGESMFDPSSLIVGALLDWEPNTKDGAPSNAYVTSIKLSGASGRISGTGGVAFQIYEFRRSPMKPASNLYVEKASF